MPPPLVVGLLGGIASGKSTVARMFAELGAEVLDADRLAHECLGLAEVQAALAAAFGNDVLDSAGRVDRATLASRAFADERQRGKLNAIVHPCVRRRISDELRAIERRGDCTVVVLDVPLLLESDLDRMCDVRVFVDAPLDVREQRARDHRQWAPAEVVRREKFQKPTEYKRAAADYMIDNGGSLESVRSRVREVFQELKQPPR